MNKTIITIATGKKLYADLAANLARSFFRWHPDSDITFLIVTDVPHLLPLDVQQKAKIVIIAPGQLGQGFSPKLHLDKLIMPGQNLFIDSDCLIYGQLYFVFDRFKGHDVSVIGDYIAKGEWFGDISSVCARFNIPHIPKFNGGIYYLEKGEMAEKVYKTARELEKQYDEIGLVRLRNRPNDELLMALAMRLHGQTPIADDGLIMSDPQCCRGEYSINVITGKTYLFNPPLPDPLHQSWYPFTVVHPVIVHFLGYYTTHYPYKMDAFRLKQQHYGKSAELIGRLKIEYPGRIKLKLKNILRPMYHSLFGVRRVKKSERIV